MKRSITSSARAILTMLLPLVVAAGCASWQPYTPTAAVPGPVICKNIRPTGSHMRQKVCYPKAVWDQMTADARAIDDAIRNGMLR